MRLPVELIRSRTRDLAEPGETTNISSCGVFLRVRVEMQVGDPLEYMLTLPPQNGSGSVRIRCFGTVVRVAPEIGIAATLERYEFMRAAA